MPKLPENTGNKKHALLRYLRYALPYKRSAALAIIGGIAKFTLPLAAAKIVQIVLDWVVIDTLNLSLARRNELLWQFGLVLLGLAVVWGISIFVRGYATVRVSSSMSFDLRRDLWGHLQRLSLAFHESWPSGKLMSRLVTDVQEAERMMTAGIVNVCIDLVAGTIALALLFGISWEMTLLVLAVLPVYGLLYRRFNPRLRQASHNVQEQTSVMSGSAVERLSGMAIVQSFAQESTEQRLFDEQADELREMTLQRGKLRQGLGASGNFLVELAKNMVWVLGAWLALRPGSEMTAGQITAFVLIARHLYLPIRRLSQINITYQMSMAAIERIFAVFDIVPEIRNRPEAVDAEPSRGEIEFDHVWFSYDGNEHVLKDLTFRVQPGERVAIVGESGAGKSTVVGLIPRLYDVDYGAIRIDGIDVRDYKLRKLRKRIGIVLQDSILFSGPIRENLRYGQQDAQERDIVDAANFANAREFIEQMPQAYDTEIGERGASLSGGQRQRVSLARTILQDPTILILDEATSSLDSESENLITEAMERIMQDRTCVIIAHRLSTVVNADRILVMREGKLVEDGPHEQLLAKGGYYSYLFEQQFGPLQDMLEQSRLDTE
ncbi:MAG: ABC transporter ATP-binding protein [Planctomycetota bacterium]